MGKYIKFFNLKISKEKLEIVFFASVFFNGKKFSRGQIFPPSQRKTSEGSLASFRRKINFFVFVLRSKTPEAIFPKLN